MTGMKGYLASDLLTLHCVKADGANKSGKRLEIGNEKFP